MTKRELYDALQRARQVTEGEISSYLLRDPERSRTDALIILSRAGRLLGFESAILKDEKVTIIEPEK